jgi:hypothetical protein
LFWYNSKRRCLESLRHVGHEVGPWDNTGEASFDLVVDVSMAKLDLLRAKRTPVGTLFQCNLDMLRRPVRTTINGYSRFLYVKRFHKRLEAVE